MPTDDFLTFPDMPPVELDRVLDDLVQRATDVMTTQGRLRALLRANSAVVSQLDLPVVLRRIIEVAVELVGAEYGALGVIAPDGGLEQFIHVGMSAEDAERIGHLPEGHGLLGALIDDPRPIRLRDLAQDSRSAGFPSGHPPMESFLGVPIRVRGEVYGNLYLSNQRSGEFSAEDEQLLESLAATAGFAVDNARLFSDSTRRQAWSAATAEVTAAVLGEERTDPAAVVLDRVMTLADADLVCAVVASVDPEFVLLEAVRGMSGAVLPGTLLPIEGSLAGKVLASRQPFLTDHAERESSSEHRQGIGPFMAVPMSLDGRVEAALTIGRNIGKPRFTTADLEMAADFAAQVSLAIELARGREDRQRVMILEDRARIARDLHDHVIQQLFATGLQLHSVAGGIGPGAVGDGVRRSIAELDGAIAQIRTAIFALSAQRGSSPALRHRIIDVVNELAPGLARGPTVAFSGAVDLLVEGDLADDVVAVTREALTNVVKHAGARAASVAVAADGITVSVEVTDNGHGVLPGGPRSGLSNLEQRALRRGGSFRVTTGGSGTQLYWSAPHAGGDEPGEGKE